MADVSIEIHSDEAIEQLKSGLLRGLEACGMQAETYAKLGCPVDTGRLRNSIAHTVVDSEYTAYIGSRVEYAAVQEFEEGFKHETGGPHFLKNSVANHVEEYHKLIEMSIDKNNI